MSIFPPIKGVGGETPFDGADTEEVVELLKAMVADGDNILSLLMNGGSKKEISDATMNLEQNIAELDISDRKVRAAIGSLILTISMININSKGKGSNW